ncbi:hypothetical protein FF38_12522 [Lucilia cuprina]|uniref:Cystatin domain-containing protein n=1 Tax=Lucilia cuprina TaxID=7375 RepID=A0A0L0BMV8_LUCCU|nr:hypothetical protein CVS40_0863 [Lucilia cuprina]KNC21430.1 hypothetical protein FF38_12522 [Lucilia cuprina]
MFKIIAPIFFATFLLKCNAEKLFGKDFENAAVILHTALNKINENGEELYTSRGIDAIYKFIPNEIYTYEASVRDSNDNQKSCQITISFSYSDANALMTIKCEGETEFTRKIVNEKPVVPDS